MVEASIQRPYIELQRLSATDTAIASDEFRHDAHTVSTELTVDELECLGDGGVVKGDRPCAADAVTNTA
jgi:hypothetical protein